MEAKRAVLPQEQNAAVTLMAGKQLLPAQWPMALQQDLWNFEPPVQLKENQIATVRRELARAAAALAEARKVADLLQGRYPITYARDVVSTRLVHAIKTTRSMVTLLEYDVLLQTQEQDLEGALASCRAILSTGRAIGDEPMPMSTVTRMFMHHVALDKIERTLAQGQPSEASLVALQRLLEDEAAQPLFLIGARAARGSQDSAMECLEMGESSINQLWSFLHIGHTPFASDWDEMMMRTESVKTSRTALLRFNNEIVEVAKRPAEEQRQALRQLAACQKQLPRLVRDAPLEALGLASHYHLDLAWMRSAIAMVAVERYRRAQDRWPEALTDLVPVYLASVPIDPFDGAPLRYRRFPEGVVLYTVGEDGQDNGGKLSMPLQPGTDMGWRLWDVRHRRQLPGR